jgi:hypothetical protein
MKLLLKIAAGKVKASKAELKSQQTIRRLRTGLRAARAFRTTLRVGARPRRDPRVEPSGSAAPVGQTVTLEYV